MSARNSESKRYIGPSVLTINIKQGSPNYGPRARCILRSHFVNDEKIIYRTYESFVDLVEYNISCNNHIV